MCIAIYKPASADLPTLEQMNNCWESNPDGFGYAIRKDGKCEIHKGFMKQEQMQAEYEKLKKYRNHDILMHFRIATHGGVNPQNTHPFPITDNIKDLGKQFIVCSKCLIHNGILPIDPRKNSISDTAELALRIGESGLRNVEAVRLLDGLTGTNKIALMNGVGVVTLGKWIEEKGVYYSNSTYSYSSYRAYAKTYSYYGGEDYNTTYGGNYGITPSIHTQTSSWNNGWGTWNKWGKNKKATKTSYAGGVPADSHTQHDNDDLPLADDLPDANDSYKDPYTTNASFREYVDAYEPDYNMLTQAEKDQLYEDFLNDWNTVNADDYEYDSEKGIYVSKSAAKEK